MAILRDLFAGSSDRLAVLQFEVPKFHRLLDITSGAGRILPLTYEHFEVIDLHDGNEDMLLRAAEVDSHIRRKQCPGREPIASKLRRLWGLPLRYLPAYLRAEARYEVITCLGGLGYLTDFDDQLLSFLRDLNEFGRYLILRESIVPEEADEEIDRPQQYYLRRISTYKDALTTTGWHLLKE